MKGQPSLEKRQRIERLLAQLKPAAIIPERLRLLRTIQILEGTGDAGARSMLERFSRGSSADSLTLQAQHALSRLNTSRPHSD
jgi:hypothetical protein